MANEIPEALEKGKKTATKASAKKTTTKKTAAKKDRCQDNRKKSNGEKGGQAFLQAGDCGVPGQG